MEFRDKASGKSKCKQIFTAGIRYLVFGVKGRVHCKHICDIMVSSPNL